MEVHNGIIYQTHTQCNFLSTGVNLFECRIFILHLLSDWLLCHLL